MMSLAKCVINDLSVQVLEYPEITIPEQGLKTKENVSQNIISNLCIIYLMQEVEFGVVTA